MTDERTPSLDADGQPFGLGFNGARRRERDVSELLGLAKGLLADGVISAEESRLLDDWVHAHPDASSVWPCSVIAERLSRIYVDGVATVEERADLASLLSDLVGEKAGIVCGLDVATRLPLDVPPPAVVFTGSVFVLTGKFAMGSRADCERLTTLAGGTCESNVTRGSIPKLVETLNGSSFTTPPSPESEWTPRS